jgi:hypothetical protein
MRKFICVVCLGTFLGCQNSQHTSYSPEELARVGQAGERQLQEQLAIDNAVANCLPVPLDLRVNDSFTIRERLHRIGAHAADSRTVVDRDGKVVYTRPEGFDETQGISAELIKILLALEKYSPNYDPSSPPEHRWTFGKGPITATLSGE